MTKLRIEASFVLGLVFILVAGVSGFAAAAPAFSLRTTTAMPNTHPPSLLLVALSVQLRRGRDDASMLRRFASSRKEDAMENATSETSSSSSSSNNSSGGGPTTDSNSNSNNNNNNNTKSSNENTTSSNPQNTEEAAGANSPPQSIPRLTNNPLRLAVLRFGMTELRGTSRYNYQKPASGTYTCGYCGAALFAATAQYDSKSGWPSFFMSANEQALQYQRELDGRMECKCQTCDSHLGHVFMDGPYEDTIDDKLLQERPDSDPISRQQQPSQKRLPRFCVNGACLDFTDE